MIVVVLDACFLILLRDTGRLNLLGMVSESMDWCYYVPEAVYLEATARMPEVSAVEQLVGDSVVNRCVAPDPLCNNLSARYPRLGRGEVEALAYALTEKDRGEEVLVVSDDGRAEKAAERLGLEIVSTLDFLGSCHVSGVMSGDEVRGYLPLLKSRNFEVKEEELRRFLASLGPV